MGFKMADEKINKEDSLQAHKTSSSWISAICLSVMLCSVSPALAQNDQNEAPVDLTKLIKTSPDNNSNNAAASSEVTVKTTTVNAVTNSATQEEETNNEDDTASSSSPIVTSTTSISVSSSLTKKDPSSIRLGSLGLERQDVDGLGRLMWEGSDASTILGLMTSLDPVRTPRAFRSLIDHMMTARAVPPEGFIDIAPDIINAKLNWLAAVGYSDDLAEMIRQLPETETWDDTKAWLILHDLMTRNDEAACRSAQKKVLVTLDALWHQINAFCAVINGDDMKAAFALDILEDSGVEDPLYFGLMRLLTDGGEMVIEDQTGLSLLNLVLMDSARQTIEVDALRTLPQSYNTSVQSLRYLSPSASRLIGARQYSSNIGADEITSAWALLPREDLSSSEALTRLRFSGVTENTDEDTTALSRLNAWHAISAEKEELSKASLAFEAMMADYNLRGISAVEFWLPLIEGGINSAEVDAKIGPLMGFSNTPSKVLMNNQALAWNDIVTPSPRPLDESIINTAAAYDVIPLIRALGRPISEINWDTAASSAVLAEISTSLPYAELMKIELSADSGRKAETILRISGLLQNRALTTLNRNDAAQLISVLIRLDMAETANNLARDILVSWAVDRHISSLNGTSADNS